MPLRRFARPDGGQSIVEFALMLPAIVLILLVLFDVATAAWQENTLAYAAREGTRYAIVHGSAAPSPAWPNSHQAVKDVVENAAVGVHGVTTTVAWPDGCYDRSCRVSVHTEAQFVPLMSRFLLAGAVQLTLSGGSMLVIQR